MPFPKLKSCPYPNPNLIVTDVITMSRFQPKGKLSSPKGNFHKTHVTHNVTKSSFSPITGVHRNQHAKLYRFRSVWTYNYVTKDDISGKFSVVWFSTDISSDFDLVKPQFLILEMSMSVEHWNSLNLKK